jgi:flagellar hook-associated protein 3 FlgL
MRVDPQYVGGLVQSLDNSTLSEQQLSSQLSTGLRVTSLSDDPVAVGQASLLGSAISQDDTFVQTATTTESRMQVSDTALGSVVTQLTSAISLAVEGNNGTENSTDLQAISQQLGSIRDEVMSLANTSYGGTYLFAGSKGSTAPYTLDTSTSPATATYNGDSIASSVATPNGQQIQTGLAGPTVFSSVLTALNNIIADFAGGTASTAAADDTAALKTALSGVSQQRSVLDSGLTRLQSASTYAQTDATQKTASQGSLVSVDTATVATQLSSVETQRSALMSVVAALEKGSLFDDIH